MYQALYRKYRPTNFEEVVGQEIIKKTIINEINNNKISHAYLFCGPRGTGKTSIAKLIAKLINCDNQHDGIPCEKCASCLSYKTNVDIIEIDAASNNGVDEIRELRNKVNLLPANSKYKIYIIDEVHMLSIGAFNALLKTLEEPPAHVIFILATTEINKIPVTIVSRCQRFDFNKISENQIFNRLKYIKEAENINITDNALKEISRLTDGGLRDAIGLLDKLISYTNEKITEEIVHEVNYSVTKKDLLKILIYIHNNQIKEYIEFIDKLDEQGKDLIKLVDELMLYLRDMIVGTEVSNDFSKEEILNYINAFNDLSSQMKNTNYPKIILETLIISFERNNISDKIIEINTEEFEDKVIMSKQNNIESIPSKLELKEKEESKILNNEQKFVEDKTETKIINNLDELKKIRINNCLATADKQLLIDLKKQWKNISEYSVNQIYGVDAGMLLDSIITIASEKNILVVFPYQSMADRANSDIPRIEEILKLTFNKEYSFIALYETEWNKIKKEYIKNVKNNIKYNYIHEESNYDILFNKKEDLIVDQAIEYFGSTVVQVI